MINTAPPHLHLTFSPSLIGSPSKYQFEQCPASLAYDHKGPSFFIVLGDLLVKAVPTPPGALFIVHEFHYFPFLISSSADINPGRIQLRMYWEV